MATEIINLSENDFTNSTIKKNGLVLVECFNNTFSTLYISEPILSKLRNKYNKNLTHYRINTDTNKFIVENYYVIKYPTYLLFNGGKLINRIEGIIPFNEFAKILEKQMNILNKG